LFVRRRRSFRN